MIVALFCTTYFGVATFFFFTWSPISLVIVADSWIVCCSAMRSQDKPKSDKLDRYCSCFFWVESYENFIVCTLCQWSLAFSVSWYWSRLWFCTLNRIRSEAFGKIFAWANNYWAVLLFLKLVCKYFVRITLIYQAMWSSLLKMNQYTPNVFAVNVA